MSDRKKLKMVSSISANAGVADPEVRTLAKRRQFSPAYKFSVLAEADRPSDSGAIGALLRREGLYSSHLSTFY